MNALFTTLPYLQLYVMYLVWVLVISLLECARISLLCY